MPNLVTYASKTVWLSWDSLSLSYARFSTWRTLAEEGAAMPRGEKGFGFSVRRLRPAIAASDVPRSGSGVQRSVG